MEVCVGATWDAITRSPRKSVWRLAQQIGATVSTAWKICRDDLFPHKMRPSQPLSEVRAAAPSAFVREYGAVLDALNFTWYFNESHFHLDVYINSPMNSAWSQQDGAIPHTTSTVLRCLRVFLRRFSWPPTSPDLSPCDYILQEHLTDVLFQEFRI
jgi:hypothetical protein